MYLEMERAYDEETQRGRVLQQDDGDDTVTLISPVSKLLTMSLGPYVWFFFFSFCHFIFTTNKKT